MSSSGFPEEHRHSTGVARLIPGTHPFSRGLKQRSHSVNLNLRSWSTATVDGVLHPNPRSDFRRVAEAVPPEPHITAWRFPVWKSISTDCMLLSMSFIAASQARFGVRRFLGLAVEASNSMALPFSQEYFGFILVYGALITLLGYAQGLYSPECDQSLRHQVMGLGKGVGWVTVLMGIAIRLSGLNSCYMDVLSWIAAFAFSGLVAWRVWSRSQSDRAVEVGRSVRNVLIVGAGTLGRELGEFFEKNPQMGFVVKGYLDDNFPLSLPVLGRIDDLDRIARAEFVDEVILAIPCEADQARRVIQRARVNRLNVKIVPELFGCAPESLVVGHMGRIPVISLHEEALPTLGLFVKRVLDVLIGVTALLLASPIMIAIAFLIGMDSAGPLTYRASRVGKKGRRFHCYKFRTMVADADLLKEGLRGLNQRQGPCFKIAEDPRITRVGRFLRRYSLDELPQLWNVLAGDMSLVGPRPHPVDDFSRYELDGLRRLDVTPGITGLWQVTARRDPSFQATMELDLEYIEKWNIWLDLRIMFRTLSVVLKGSGA